MEVQYFPEVWRSPRGKWQENIAEKQRPGHAAGALFVGVRCLYHLQGLRSLHG